MRTSPRKHNPSDVEALIEAARENRSAGRIRRLILKLVPEYASALDTGAFAIGGDAMPLDVSLTETPGDGVGVIPQEATSDVQRQPDRISAD